MASPRLRILSDLHYAEPPSQIKRLEMLRPLLDEPGQTVLNGDSLEMRFIDSNRRLAEERDRFFAFLSEFEGRVHPISGNHDPYISERHHLDLGGGRVLVTHGDVLFPGVAPWGWEAPQVRAEQERLARETPEETRSQFETRLKICKLAAFSTRHLSPSQETEAVRPLAQFFRLASRIRRADRILTSWIRTPGVAARLLAEHRPKGELIIIGHTHYPGVWRRGRHTIINTGAFTPPFSALAVDVAEDRIEVRAIRKKGGEFRIGDVVRTLPIALELETAQLGNPVNP